MLSNQKQLGSEFKPPKVQSNLYTNLKFQVTIEQYMDIGKPKMGYNYKCKISP